LFGVGERLEPFTDDALQVQAKDVFMGNTPLPEPLVLPVAPVAGAANVPLPSWEQPLEERPHDLGPGARSFDQTVDLLF
jgi:hypothetical protein